MDRPLSITAGAVRPGLRPGRRGPGRRLRPADCAALGGRLPGRDGEQFGVDLAVVLDQDLAEVARPVRDGVVAVLAACNGQLGNGNGDAAGI
jgi:hypothetical protein